MNSTMAVTLMNDIQYSAEPKVCTEREFTKSTMEAKPIDHSQTGEPGNHQVM